MFTAIKLSSSLVQQVLQAVPEPLHSQVAKWLTAYDQLPPFNWVELEPYRAGIAAKLTTCGEENLPIDSVLLARLYLLADLTDKAVDNLILAWPELKLNRPVTHLHPYVQPFYDQRDHASLPQRQSVTYHAAEAVGHTDGLTRKQALLNEALQMAKQLGDPSKIMYAARELGLTYIHNGNTEHGAELLQQALHYAQQSQDPYETATTFMVLAIASWYANDFERAYQLNENAYHIFKRIGRIDRQIVTLINMGEVSAQLGRFSHAENFLTEAIDLQAGEVDTPPYYRAHAWRFLLDVHILQHRWDDAQRAAQRAEALMLTYEDKHGLIALQASTGLLALRHGDPQSAIEIWQSALAPTRALNRPHNLLMLYIHAPAAYIAVGQREAAIDAVGHVCRIAELFEDDEWRKLMAIIGFGYILWYDEDITMLEQLIASLQALLINDADVQDALFWLKHHTQPKAGQLYSQPTPVELLYMALKNRYHLN